jgi:uncharacterized protein DUF6188
MYGLDPKTDLSFLLGREVQQVAIGIHQVQIRFDQKVCIAIESRFQYSDRLGQTFECHADHPVDATRLVELLGTALTDFRPEPSGTLALKFGTAGTLILFDDSKEYESYQISTPDRYIVV